MKYPPSIPIACFLIILMIGCSRKYQKITGPISTETKVYVEEIVNWQERREKSLSRANAWTTLTGLFWLKDGKQSFGSGENQDVRFPDGMPESMGEYILANDSLSCTLIPELAITIDDKRLTQSNLKSDADESPSLFNWKSHFWYPIKRGDRFGLRLRDTLHPNRFINHDIPNYPIDTNWKIKAKVLSPQADQQVKVDNIIGTSQDSEVAAILEFEKEGHKHQILALDGGPNSFFLIIADETSGEDTYGGGRYLVVDRPVESDETYIDFNKAYNPPCVFTNYATCPLPPKENYLKLAITAGEKMVHFEH